MEQDQNTKPTFPEDIIEDEIIIKSDPAANDDREIDTNTNEDSLNTLRDIFTENGIKKERQIDMEVGSEDFYNDETEMNIDINSDDDDEEEDQDFETGSIFVSTGIEDSVSTQSELKFLKF